MAKLSAPLLSLGASGQLAKALVYSRWKGLSLAREYVIPANPKSTDQVTQRGYMTAAVAAWHAAQVAYTYGPDMEAWNRYAGVLGPMSGFNAFCREWVNELVAGGNPAEALVEGQCTSPIAGNADFQVERPSWAAQNVTFHAGVTRTFFPYSATVAAVAGVATFGGEAVPGSAGDVLYFWFSAGVAGATYGRTGLYTVTLT